VETDLMTYEVAHETDMVEIIEKNQNEIENLKEQLGRYEKEFTVKDREITELRKDIVRSRELYKELQQENHEMFAKFEDKIEDFKDMMKSDNNKYLEKKAQANHEIEMLRNQLRDVTKELKAKNQEIDGMDYRIKSQKDELLRYKSVEYDRPARLEKHSIDFDKSSSHILLKGGNNDVDSFLSKPIRTGTYNLVNGGSGKKLRFTTEENQPERTRETGDFTLSKARSGAIKY